MAEHGEDGTGDSTLSDSVYKGLTMEDLRRGAIFPADVEEDFELGELYMSDTDSDDEMDREGEKKKVNNLYRPPLPLAEIDGVVEELTADGMVKKVTIHQTGGVTPPFGSRLAFEYVAFPEGGKEHFDAATGKKAHEVILNENAGLIIGLKIALNSMRLGDQAVVWIHYSLAYGELGCPPRIPARKSVVFNIRLKEFRTPAELKLVEYMTAKERKELSFDEILKGVKTMRNEANLEFAQNNFQKAASKYRKAAHILEDYSNLDDDQAMGRAKLLAVLCANAAAAYLNLGKAPQACANCKRALEQPVEVGRDKIYFRFAKAKLALGAYPEALNYLEKARRAGAPASSCNELRQAIFDKQKLDDDKARQMYRMMLSNK